MGKKKRERIVADPLPKRFLFSLSYARKVLLRLYFDVISAVKDEIRNAQYRVVPTESF